MDLVQQQNNMITFNYKNYKKQTINSFLLKKGYSDNNIYYLIKNKKVLVNKEIVKDKNHLLSFFDEIKVTLLDEENTLLKYESSLDVVYEDKYFLIVNKLYDIDVEPTKLNNESSLANMVSYYFYKNNIKSKIHLVNRLDKLTTGLVIIAKNQYIHNLFSKVKITKKYLAKVKGKTNKKGTIKIRIEKDENSIKRIVTDNGKLCITKYKTLSFDGNNSLVEIDLLTGRTHQIRVSFAHINHPLVSDSLYGSKEDEDMYLKAYYLKFKHPITNKTIKITRK